MRTQTVPLLAMGVVLGLACGAGAQPPATQTGSHTQLTLEQLMMAEVPVVRGASRYAQQIVDAPSSITVITREEIERFGHQTMADVLRGIRGFYVTYDRNYSYVGARGLARPGDYNTRTLLLVNGHRLNDNIYDSLLLGTEFPIDLELVERIEVVRGPSSSLYGTSAFLAVINVVTRGGAGPGGIRADLLVGTLGTRGARASTGRLFAGGTEAIVAASIYSSDGQGAAGGVAPGMDGDGAGRLFGAVSHGPWSAQAAYAAREKVIPTGAFGVAFDDPRSRTFDMRAFGSIAFDGQVRGTLVTARAYHDWYAYDGAYAMQESPLLLEEARGRWWGVEAQSMRRWRTHRVTAGVELRHNTRQDQRSWEETLPVLVYLDDRRQSTNWAVYVQDEWRLAPAILLNAGVRHDSYPLFGDATSPRLALILKPSATSAVKLLHGSAFRAPSLFESYYYSATPTLRPERITTNEIVAELYEQPGLRLAVSGFIYRVSDLITQSVEFSTDLGVGFVNEDDVHAAGLEIEAERAWPGGWTVGGSYTLQEALHRESGATLSNSPGQTVHVRGSAPILGDRVSAALETLHTARRATTRGTEVPAYTLASLTVRSIRPLAGGMSWSLRADNLLNERYFDPGTDEHPIDLIQQNGRTVSLTLSWRF